MQRELQNHHDAKCLPEFVHVAPVAPQLLSEDDDSRFERIMVDEDLSHSGCLTEDTDGANGNEHALLCRTRHSHQPSPPSKDSLTQITSSLDSDTTQDQCVEIFAKGRETISPVVAAYSASEMDEGSPPSFDPHATTSLVSTDMSAPRDMCTSSTAQMCIPRKATWTNGSSWEWGIPENLHKSGASAVPETLHRTRRFDFTQPEPCSKAQPRPESKIKPKLGNVERQAVIAQAAILSARATRPASARVQNISSSFAGISPRTNVRERMGMWSGPNTPGPGAYDVGERNTLGGTLFTAVDRKRIYGRCSKFTKEARLPTSPAQVKSIEDG
jgi:hypothetical protein